MNYRYLAVAVAVVLMTGCGKLGGGVSLSSDTDKASYAIGQQIAKGMKSQGVEVNVDTLAGAMKDVFAGKESRLTEEEMKGAMMALQTSVMTKQSEKTADNKKKGDEFLAENKKKPGVKTTSSGLQYEIVGEGTGPVPTDKDTVKVNYKGTLIDGTEFDSSYKRGQPAEFPVTGVIKGWTEALKLMQTGAKWKLYIPPDIAYGEKNLPNIPANSVLVFDVELLEIAKAGKK